MREKETKTRDEIRAAKKGRTLVNTEPEPVSETEVVSETEDVSTSED